MAPVNQTHTLLVGQNGIGKNMEQIGKDNVVYMFDHFRNQWLDRTTDLNPPSVIWHSTLNGGMVTYPDGSRRLAIVAWQNLVILNMESLTWTTAQKPSNLFLIL